MGSGDPVTVMSIISKICRAIHTDDPALPEHPRERWGLLRLKSNLVEFEFDSSFKWFVTYVLERTFHARFLNLYYVNLVYATSGCWRQRSGLIQLNFNLNMKLVILIFFFMLKIRMLNLQFSIITL